MKRTAIPTDEIEAELVARAKELRNRIASCKARHEEGPVYWKSLGRLDETIRVASILGFRDAVLDATPDRRQAVEGCQTCMDGNGLFAPSHDASESCQSGKHTHCSCNVCF